MVATFRGSGTYGTKYQIKRRKGPLSKRLTHPQYYSKVTIPQSSRKSNSQDKRKKNTKQASHIMIRCERKTMAQWPRPNVVSGKKIPFIIR
jgi:hypothetical protein